jgi:putative transposase
LRLEYRVSERRACELMGVARSSCRYQPQRGDDEGLQAALRGLALERAPFGYRRLWAMLRRRGWVVNRRRVATPRLPLMLPTRADEVWTMDFTHDALASEVDTSLPGLREVRMLEQMRQKYGAPQRIQVDNGPDLVSQVVDQWAYQYGVALRFIRPGKPTDKGLNSYCTS